VAQLTVERRRDDSSLAARQGGNCACPIGHFENRRVAHPPWRGLSLFAAGAIAAMVAEQKGIVLSPQAVFGSALLGL
jgi:hypothetical protein